MSLVEPAKLTQRAAEVIERRRKNGLILHLFRFGRGKLPEDLYGAARRGRDIFDPAGRTEILAKGIDHDREAFLELGVRGFGRDQRFADRYYTRRGGNALVESASGPQRLTEAEEGRPKELLVGGLGQLFGEVDRTGSRLH